MGFARIPLLLAMETCWQDRSQKGPHRGWFSCTLSPLSERFVCLLREKNATHANLLLAQGEPWRASWGKETWGEGSAGGERPWGGEGETCRKPQEPLAGESDPRLLQRSKSNSGRSSKVGRWDSPWVLLALGRQAPTIPGLQVGAQ